MVDDDREVALSLAVADLVDPDPSQAIEQVDLALRLGGDPLEDPADRAPRDPHQRSHRRLGAVHSQPRALIFKRLGEPRPMTRPGHRRNDHPVPLAGHPRRFSLYEREPRPQVQRPPPPTTVTEIEPRAPTPAHPAAVALPPPRPDSHDHLPLAAAVDVLDDHGLQPKQPGPYPCSAHAASAPLDSSLRTTGTLGAARRAPFFSPSPHPRKQQERQKKYVGEGFLVLVPRRAGDSGARGLLPWPPVPSWGDGGLGAEVRSRDDPGVLAQVEVLERREGSGTGLRRRAWRRGYCPAEARATLCPGGPVRRRAWCRGRR